MLLAVCGAFEQHRPAVIRSSLPLNLRGGGIGKLDEEKARVKAELEAMDVDKSGTITLDEYMAYEKRLFDEKKKEEWTQAELKLKQKCARSC